MKDFLKDLIRWWNDPVTEKVFTGIGVFMIAGTIANADKAMRSAGDAHERIDKLENTLEALGR